MGALSMLAPWFLAGLSLLAIPYWVHKIHKPERAPVRFPSLMFVPRVKKEVIERRNLQHILLMLLRMLLLALLALAFSRPYWSSAVPAEAEADAVPAVILLDASYSMGLDGAFGRAKALAEEIVNDLPAGSRAGAIVFSGAADAVAPLYLENESPAESRARARAAIAGAELTFNSTHYPEAVKAANALFERYPPADGKPVPGKIHLITDFRRNGMAGDSTAGKLPEHIELIPHDMGKADAPDNLAVSDIAARRTANGPLRIAGKIRNDSDAERSVRAALVVGGETLEEKTVPVRAGNASGVAFDAPVPVDAPLTGWIEVEDGALEADNRRYFAANPERKKRLWVIAGEGGDEAYPADWFIERAMRPHPAQPWTAERVEFENWTGALDAADPAPDALAFAGVNTVSGEDVQRLWRWVENGGAAVWIMAAGLDPESANRLLEPAGGLRRAGLRHGETRASQFERLGWIDFDHPVFYPLRGAKHNDFTPVRFHNHHRLEFPEGEDGAAPWRVLASFEGGGDGNDPAILEIAAGDGLLTVWTFDLTLAWTNLPKTVKFIPVWFETLRRAAGGEEFRTQWLVGEPAAELRAAMDGGEGAVTQLPGKDGPVEWNADSSGSPLTRPGIVLQRPADQTAWTRAAAVNPGAEESTPARIEPEELLLQFSTAPDLAAAVSETERDEGPAETERHEFARIFLVMLVGFLIAESVLAARLS